MATVRPQIVLFGDSITQWCFKSGGWGASMADHYTRKADVVLRGYSGYNTRFAKSLLNKIFPIPAQISPLLVTVFFGANDAADPAADHAVLNVPLPEYRKNLHEIVAHLKKQSDSTHIVIITPPPISVRNLLCHQLLLYEDTSNIPSRRNDLTKLYAEECVKVAHESGVLVVDIWSSFQETPDWEDKFLSDGLHLSPEGNAKVFEELVKTLEDPALIPTLNPEDMPYDFSEISDLVQFRHLPSKH